MIAYVADHAAARCCTRNARRGQGRVQPCRTARAERRWPGEWSRGDANGVQPVQVAARDTSVEEDHRRGTSTNSSTLSIRRSIRLLRGSGSRKAGFWVLQHTRAIGSARIIASLTIRSALRMALGRTLVTTRSPRRSIRHNRDMDEFRRIIRMIRIAPDRWVNESCDPSGGSERHYPLVQEISAEA